LPPIGRQVLEILDFLDAGYVFHASHHMAAKTFRFFASQASPRRRRRMFLNKKPIFPVDVRDSRTRRTMKFLDKTQIFPVDSRGSRTTRTTIFFYSNASMRRRRRRRRRRGG